jgi:hypothetical protein
MQNETRQYDAIVAVRDLNGPEHRVDINPHWVFMDQIYELLRMKIEFVVLIPAGQSDEILDRYAQIALEALQWRVDASS